MIMAMMRLDRATGKEELIWTPDMDEVDALEEIEAFLESIGEEIVRGIDEKSLMYIFKL
jgi:hypothetical protein